MMSAADSFDFSDQWPAFDEIRPGHELLFRRGISPTDVEAGGTPLQYLKALALRAGCDRSAEQRLRQYTIYWEGGQRLKQYGLDRTLLSGPTREEFLFVMEGSASSGEKQKTKWATFEKDLFVCAYCRQVDGKVDVQYLLRLDVDHFLGRKVATPFYTACMCCNKLKRDRKYHSLGKAMEDIQALRKPHLSDYENLARAGWPPHDARTNGKIFAADHWTCRYCDLDARTDFIYWYTLQRDHFQPVHHGGASATNSVTACPRCNQWKSKRLYNSLAAVRKIVAENIRAWGMIWEKLRRDRWRVVSLRPQDRLLVGR